jgi:hypothetical protein
LKSEIEDSEFQVLNLCIFRFQIENFKMISNPKYPNLKLSILNLNSQISNLRFYFYL